MADLGPTLPTIKIIGIHRSGPTGPTSGLPCQPTKSLEFIALSPLGLPRAYLANHQNHWNSLLWAYWAYLGLALPTIKIGIHCSGPTGPTLGLPWAYLANQQNHWNSLLWAYWAYRGPTLPTSKIIGMHCSGITGPTSGSPCQPTKSLEFIALGLLVLARAYLANQ